ncbi:MAG TPA: ABC transporter permease [Candidatus Acidoferrales bacterium]|nr:ABC transporter permease [Candidatus Acidoferrales bacterium]
MKDLVHGLRLLRKNPGFAAVAVIVLGLGIGANTALFSVVDAVLLRPLPYPDSSRLVRVYHVPPAKSFPGIKIFSVSPANYLDWAAQNHVFEQMAIQGYRSFNLTGLAQPEAVPTARVSSSFFSVLRTQPMLGRAFPAEDDRAGQANAVILSYRLWKGQFAGDPKVVGRKLTLDGESYTIDGVMGPGFRMPSDVKLWVPLGWTDKDRAVRSVHNYKVLARLKAGVDVRQAQAEMNAISARLEQRYPQDDAGWGALVMPLEEAIVGDARPALLVLLGAVAFVLLIACANVANLVLAKTLGRRKEMAIRTALGATRGRVVAQALSETVLLALGGGAAGWLLARASEAALVRALARELPRASEIRVDGWVLGFTLGISLLAGILAGLLPAWRMTKTNVNEALKQGLGKTDADTGGERTRSVLVISEVALSLVLLAGAGLMIRSLWALDRVNPGFDPHNVLTVTISIPQAKYPQPARQSAFFNQVLARVRALPGVQAAGTIDALPLSGNGSTQPIVIEGRSAGILAEQPEVAVRLISTGYIPALRIPVLAGRDFNDGDTAGREPAILVSRLMADEFWPGKNPIGRHVTLSFTPGKVRTVVGVVGDVKDNGLNARLPQATIYVPMNQEPWVWLSVVLRTTAAPTSTVSAVTDAVHRVDPDEPLLDVGTMGALVADSLFQQRFAMLLLGTFAGLALLLAGVGIYSVLAYGVRRRVREISIRMALGAQVNDVLRMVLYDGMRSALVGVAIGVAGALALSRTLANLIYGVKSTDPATFIAVSALLVAVAALASVVPAYRATRVRPIQALREE